MQYTKTTTGRTFELPNGYGPLVETMQIVGQPGLQGTLFVHVQAGREGQGALVASLRLKGAGNQVTFKHLWEPKTPHETAKGSTLLFRNAPNNQRGEDWDSDTFKARRVAVFDGPRGPFATTPFGIVNLERREARQEADAKLFDLAGFQVAAVAMKASVQAKDPATRRTRLSPAQTCTTVLSAIQARQGVRGVTGEDLVEALRVHGIASDDVKRALETLMEDGRAYEPTINRLRAT